MFKWPPLYSLVCKIFVIVTFDEDFVIICWNHKDKKYEILLTLGVGYHIIIFHFSPHSQLEISISAHKVNKLTLYYQDSKEYIHYYLSSNTNDETEHKKQNNESDRRVQ